MRICRRCSTEFTTKVSQRCHCDECTVLRKKKAEPSPRICRQCSVEFIGQNKNHIYCNECATLRNKISIYIAKDKQPRKIIDNKRKYSFGETETYYVCRQCSTKFISTPHNLLYCDECTVLRENTFECLSSRKCIDNVVLDRWKKTFGDKLNYDGLQHICQQCSIKFTSKAPNRLYCDKCAASRKKASDLLAYQRRIYNINLSK